MALMVLAETIPDIPILGKKRKRRFVRVFYFPGAVRQEKAKVRKVMS